MPVAVVTGGSGGIGAEVVAELRARRWQVISLSRRDGCDITDEEQVTKAFAALGSLDALIHCAAVLIKRSFVETSAKDWDAQLGAGSAFRSIFPFAVIANEGRLIKAAGTI